MILEIRLANFFSISEEVVLDLRAAPLPNTLPDNTFAFGKTKVLKSAALYGANASGKSNLIRAMAFCVGMITQSHTHNETSRFNFQPFKFGGYAQQPSRFFVRFVHKGIEYEYGFVLTITEILEETLHYYPKNRKTKIFTRHEASDKPKKDLYSFSGLIRRPLDVAESTSRKTLYVSRASQMDREICKEIFQFFAEKVIFHNPLLSNEYLEQFFSTHKSSLLKALSIADSDITDMRLEKRQLRGKNIQLDHPTQTVSIQDTEAEAVEIFTYHRQNPAVAFRLEEESRGTQLLFYLFLLVLPVIRRNAIWIVDELENSLHNHILTYVLKLFHAGEQAQVLFATHNTYLLDLKFFRKDQLFFVNKRADGSTDLYALYDYKDFDPKKMDLLQSYLEGRFDAIPYVRDRKSNLQALIHETNE